MKKRLIASKIIGEKDWKGCLSDLYNNTKSKYKQDVLIEVTMDIYYNQLEVLPPKSWFNSSGIPASVQGAFNAYMNGGIAGNKEFPIKEGFQVGEAASTINNVNVFATYVIHEERFFFLGYMVGLNKKTNFPTHYK